MIFLTFSARSDRSNFLSVWTWLTAIFNVSLGKAKNIRSMNPITKHRIEVKMPEGVTKPPNRYTPTPLFPSNAHKTGSTGNDWHLDVLIMKSNQEKHMPISDFGISFGPLSALYMSANYYRHFRRILKHYGLGFYKIVGPRMNEGWCQAPLIDGVFADAVTKGIAPDLHENIYSYAQTAQKQIPLNILKLSWQWKLPRPLGYLRFSQCEP